MEIVVVGNIIALIASVIMVQAGYVKDKKKILILQMIQIGLYAISNLVLGGYTGAIINVLCCFRDFLCYKDKLGIKEKVIIIIASTALSIVFNNMGWIGYLPVISTAIYIMFMSVKDVIKFKYLTIFSMVAWAIYNFYIKSYTGVAFNIFTIITCIIAIVQIYKKRKLNN